MSTETKIWCDRCLILITRDRSRFTLETGPERLIRPTVDLCPDCLESFFDWLDDERMKKRKALGE